MIFHIAAKTAWERGSYETPSLRQEGLVHCSKLHQVVSVANALFFGQKGLVLLCIDPSLLEQEVRWERPTPTSSETSPHVYGPVNPRAVVAVVDFPPEADGTFRLPWEASRIARRTPTTLEALKQRVQDLMDGFSAPWWVAGGWALDLFLQRVTRVHYDIDIAILSRDQDEFLRRFAGWEIRIAHEGILIEKLSGEGIEPPHHQVWMRVDDGTPARTPEEFAADPTYVGILFEQADDGHWIYRRDKSVRLPLDSFGLVSDEGIPFVRPEVCLLYRAKDPLDERYAADFAAVVPHLASEGRLWSRETFTRLHPDHPWIAALE